jgi:hypothetical protein
MEMKRIRKRTAIARRRTSAQKRKSAKVTSVLRKAMAALNHAKEELARRDARLAVLQKQEAAVAAAREVMDQAVKLLEAGDMVGAIRLLRVRKAAPDRILD